MDLRIIRCFAVAGLLLALSPRNAGADEAGIHGIVFAPETDAPMDGVTIRVMDNQVTTNQEVR